MLIKDLYEYVEGLPTLINVIDQEDNHIWIGEIDRTPEEIKMRSFSKAYIRDWGANPQITFYIK